jgi:hypothetical protein
MQAYNGGKDEAESIVYSFFVDPLPSKWGIFNAAMAVSDIFLLKSLYTLPTMISLMITTMVIPCIK